MMIDELIARLSAATGSDRKIDYMIQQHLDGKPIVEIQTWWTAHGFVSLKTGEDGHKNMEDVPRYTASLDAALTLIPGDAVWHVMTDYGDLKRAKVGPANNPGASIYRDAGRPLFVQADAATPVLALCIAALKARALNSEPSR